MQEMQEERIDPLARQGQVTVADIGRAVRGQGAGPGLRAVDMAPPCGQNIPASPARGGARSQARPPRRGLVHTGFQPASERLHRVYNLTLASLLLVPALPPMAVIAVALLLTQGPSIIYRGERLGRDRRPFHIFKFRTLDTRGALDMTKNSALPRNSGLETPLGRYLRATRLDELPQLFNILRGDMNICGPRPVRRSLADIETARNPLYEVRFRVKPGLVGHTQAYMSHGASKHLRAKYNAMLCVSPVIYHREIALFARVGLSVMRNAMTEMARRLFPRDPVTRARRRARLWQLVLFDPETADVLPVEAITRDHLVVPATAIPRSLPRGMQLRIAVAPAGARRARLTLKAAERTEESWAIAYDAATPGAQYLLERYVFGDVVVRARPRRAAPCRASRAGEPAQGTESIVAGE